MTLTEKCKTVLMADDDPEDCLLAREAFAEIGAEAEFVCVGNGIELLAGLKERRQEKGLPAFILLDFNMPQKDGREALVEIKAEPALRHLPIVILTTSREKRDVDFAMEAGAACFITKPDTFDEWIEIMRSLAARWISAGKPVNG